MAWDFQKVKANIQATKGKLPRVLAEQAQRYFVNSWQTQGWNGKHWLEVQRRTPGTQAYKRATAAERTAAILVKSGTLRRAVNDSIRKVSFDQIRLAVGDKEAPYAGYHNKGTDHIPQRQFMGQTRALTAMQRRTIDKHFKTVWK